MESTVTGDRVDVETVATLRDKVRGEVLEPGDPGYDESRRVWNARIDRRPRAILRCRGAADVMAGVDVAREHDLPLAVKGGGHHVSGSAVCEDGIVLDCGRMDAVRVAPDERTARVQAGATWGQVDHETQTFGLAVPGGQDPNIGVAGLTLGGGVGWLSRQYGHTCDNLRAADVVTADGDLVRASPDANPDLFWALRGGGGNFGVVTEFEFDCHPVGPAIYAGSLVYPHEEFPAVAALYRSFMADAPREVRLLLGSMVLPDSDVFPPAAQDERVAILVACYAGPPDEGERVLNPLRSARDPVFDSLRERTYTAFQRAGDSEGRLRTDLRSQYLSTLSDGAIETIAEFAADAPSAGATVFVSPRGGAETDPATDATAFPHREDAHHCLVECRWADAADDDRHVEWTRSCHRALAPYRTDGVPLNFLTEDAGPDRIRAAYGENYDRLAAVKAEWDPENVFGRGQPVEPDW